MQKERGEKSERAASGRGEGERGEIERERETSRETGRRCEIEGDQVRRRRNRLTWTKERQSKREQ